MSIPKFVTTPKGTELPLLLLKGKPYLQVAHRLVWFAETTEKYTTDVNLLILTDTQTAAQVTITMFDGANNVTRRVSDVKRETADNFPDHTEKAITGALGRCLAQLGFGTAYALADLDEGERIVDSPVEPPKKAKGEVNALQVKQGPRTNDYSGARAEGAGNGPDAKVSRDEAKSTPMAEAGASGSGSGAEASGGREEILRLISANAKVVTAKRVMTVAEIKAEMFRLYGVSDKEKLSDARAAEFLTFLKSKI